MTALGMDVSSRERTVGWEAIRPSSRSADPRTSLLADMREQVDLAWRHQQQLADRYADGLASLEEVNQALSEAQKLEEDYRCTYEMIYTPVIFFPASIVANS